MCLEVLFMMDWKRFTASEALVEDGVFRNSLSVPCVNFGQSASLKFVKDFCCLMGGESSLLC